MRGARVMQRLLQFWRRSLRARLVGSYLLFATLMVGVVALLAYLSAVNALRASAFERLGAVAMLKEDTLNRWVDEQRRYVVLIAALPEARAAAGDLLHPATAAAERGAAETALSRLLNLIVTNTSDSQELLMLDAQGRIFFSTVPAHIGQSQAGSAYFLKGLTTTYVQNAYSAAFSGKPTITISTPLFDQHQRRIGVLASHLNLAQIDRLVRERTGLGQSGETYLVNADHQLVSETPLAGGRQADLHSSGIDAALAGRDGAQLYANYQGTPSLGVYHWVDEREVALLVEISQAEAFASARGLAEAIGGVGLSVVAALAVIIAVIARRMTRPILLLTKTAQGVAAGDLSLRAPVLTQDEVGTLARVFNQMTERLRELIGGLERRLAELRQTQAALQASEARFRTIFDSVNDAIFVHDLKDGHILDVNRKMSELYGYTRVEARALSVGDISEGTPPYTQAEALSWMSHAAAGEPQLFEWRAKDRVGQLFWVEVNMRKALIDEQERLLVSVRDITDRKRAEAVIQAQNEQLQAQNEELIAQRQALLQAEGDLLELNAELEQRVVERTAQLEAANKELESFSYSVSHDLRAPLRAVAGFSRVLLEEYAARLEPEAAHYLQRVHAGTQRMGRLIDDLLAFARLGRQALKPRLLTAPDLREMVSQTIEELRAGASAPKCEVVIGELSPCYADPALLRQVFSNLLSNAFKFSRARADARVALGCVAAADDGPVYFVRDNGAGFDMRYASKLFGVFQRLHSGDDFEGTGVGLAIVQRIVLKHGGRIWAEAAPGQGATFYFTLGALP